MIEYVSGCVGGIAGVIVGQPFDTVKVRLQTQSSTYRGVWHCFRSIIEKETAFGLYKGMQSPLIGLSVINAIVFGVEAQTISLLGKDTTQTHFVSGMVAGAVQCVICSPMELAKTQMQVQGIGKRRSTEKIVYRNSVDALVKIYQKDGIRGCYRGMVTTLIRETPAFGCYFATYDLLTSHVFYVDKTETYTWKGICNMMCAGGCSGMASWAITYPVDVVKSHLQADGVGGKPMKYSGTTDCIRQLWHRYGLRGFFWGLNSCLLRAFPVNAATFAVVSVVSQYLYSRQKGSDIHRKSINQT